MPGEEVIEAARGVGTYAAQNPGLLSEIGSAVYNAFTSEIGQIVSAVGASVGAGYGLLELGGCATASATGSEYEDGLPRSPEKREEDIRQDLTTIDGSAYGPISSMAIDHYAEK